MPGLVRHFYRHADAIVPNSEGVLTDLMTVTGLPRSRFTKIYNPMVTPRLFELCRRSPEHPWFEHSGVPVVLAVGRLEEQKDYPTLLRAFAEVRRSRRVRLLIFGEGSERAGLEDLARRLAIEEDVGLPGFTSNPYAAMASAACFVLSSRWEGLPGVLVEALACGAPLVATDCPSGPREILENGRFGKLVSVGDVKGLAEAIGQVLDGDVKVAPEDSRRRFEVRTVTEQYLDLIRSA